MSLLSEIIERFRAVFRRAAEERELHEEIRFHLDMQAQQNAERGLSVDEGASPRGGHVWRR